MRTPTLITLLILLSSPFLLAEHKAKSKPGFAVVELFTSQGGSSYPPADKLLAQIAAGAEPRGTSVFTLSFHVDY